MKEVKQKKHLEKKSSSLTQTSSGKRSRKVDLQTLWLKQLQSISGAGGT
jgi:hypothetical protein